MSGKGRHTHLYKYMYIYIIISTHQRVNVQRLCGQTGAGVSAPGGRGRGAGSVRGRGGRGLPVEEDVAFSSNHSVSTD